MRVVGAVTCVSPRARAAPHYAGATECTVLWPPLAACMSSVVKCEHLSLTVLMIPAGRCGRAW